MNYSTYFSTNTTDYIAKDLIGRMLTFDNGQEKLGGYIVEAEAYMGKKDRAAHSYGGRRSPANEGLYGKDGVLLTNGPAKMMQAFGIHDKNWNLHFLSDSPFAIDLDDRHKKIPQEIIAAARVGINQSDPVWANKKLRFYVAGNPYVSDMKKRNYETNNGWA
ncbi:3-methyladenine DNA glycosylase [Lactobacillus crispatus]|uniref:DNA-3-methyladenine glycosylase n=1 Tax=Lactobacillus crispatus TaxID=47770 RepID=UPI000C7CE3FC|nr:DNA-3-methyladenine glycosylase [Lactobacillus crispatus]PKZ26671.1 3-methyladenine DNA glycosylase [Lactobacillus crispatus]